MCCLQLYFFSFYIMYSHSVLSQYWWTFSVGVHPSSEPALSCRTGSWELEPTPAIYRHEAGCKLDRSPVRHSVEVKWKIQLYVYQVRVTEEDQGHWEHTKSVMTENNSRILRLKSDKLLYRVTRKWNEKNMNSKLWGKTFGHYIFDVMQNTLFIFL